MLKLKKTFLFAALGIMFAQSAVMLTASSVSATEIESELSSDANGTCYPRSNNICGLNGHNYSDKAYQG